MAESRGDGRGNRTNLPPRPSPRVDERTRGWFGETQEADRGLQRWGPLARLLGQARDKSICPLWTLPLDARRDATVT